MSETKRIIVADDHAIVRKGMVQIIKEGLSMPIIDEVGDAESLFAAILKQEYHLAILDVTLPGRSGLDMLTDIRLAKPQLPVLIVSINPVEHYGLRALKRGASGYLEKDAAPTELMNAVHQLLLGKKYLTPELGQQLIDNLDAPATLHQHEKLSDRELEVLLLLAKGSGIKDIADKLSLSVTTVSTYRSRILEKMNMRSNADLIHYVIEKKML